MGVRRKGSHPLLPETCRAAEQGAEKPAHPTVTYVKCPRCGGFAEVWSDEDTGSCLECGAEWERPR